VSKSRPCSQLINSDLAPEQTTKSPMRPDALTSRSQVSIRNHNKTTTAVEQEDTARSRNHSTEKKNQLRKSIVNRTMRVMKSCGKNRQLLMN